MNKWKGRDLAGPVLKSIRTVLSLLVFGWYLGGAMVRGEGIDCPGITYQGQLKRDGTPVTAICELRMRLYDAESSGSPIGPEVVRTASIERGLFTVDGLDFGVAAFQVGPRWLEIEILCPGEANPVLVQPRQHLTAVPVALHTCGTTSVVNVRDFGAKGDGITDDTYAFHKARDAATAYRCSANGAPCHFYVPSSCPTGTCAATGGSLYIPSGTYLVDALDLIRDDIWIHGEGPKRTILKSAASNDVIRMDRYAAPGRILIENLSIEGTGPTSGSGRGIAFVPRGTDIGMVTIRNVEISKCGGSGLVLFRTYNLLLEEVSITDCGDDLFNIGGGNTTTLIRCYAHEVMNGKAAYRIRSGKPVLISCNGITAGANADWGVFGGDGAEGDWVCQRTSQPCVSDADCASVGPCVLWDQGNYCAENGQPCNSNMDCYAGPCQRPTCRTGNAPCTIDSDCGENGPCDISRAYCFPTLIGCNIEQFTNRGCYFKLGSRGTFIGTEFKHVTAGVSATALQYDYVGNANLPIFDANSTIDKIPTASWDNDVAVHSLTPPFVTFTTDTYLREYLPPSGKLDTIPSVTSWCYGNYESTLRTSFLKVDGLKIGGTPADTTGRITEHLSATATWDPAEIADDDAAETEVVVPGAALGDTIVVAFSQPLCDASAAGPCKALLTGSVTAAGIVEVTFLNMTGALRDLPAGQLRVDVWKH